MDKASFFRIMGPMAIGRFNFSFNDNLRWGYFNGWSSKKPFILMGGWCIVIKIFIKDENVAISLYLCLGTDK